MTPNRFAKSTKNRWKSNPGTQTDTFGAPSNPSTTNEWSKVQKNRSPCPKIGPQNLKKHSISAVNLFNKSSMSVINLFNKNAYQQSTYQQVTEGAGGRGEALRYKTMFVKYYIILVIVVVVLRAPRTSQSAAEGDRFLKKVCVPST